MSGMQHFDHELAELDKQIVRLGKLCGFDVTQDTQVLAIIEGKTLPESLDPELRKAFVLLKGLLGLRYITEKQCVEDIGPNDCKKILSATLLK